MELEPITHLEKSIAGTVAPVTHLEKVIEQYGGGGGGGGATSLNDLSDVEITNLNSGQALVYKGGILDRFTNAWYKFSDLGGISYNEKEDVVPLLSAPGSSDVVFDYYKCAESPNYDAATAQAVVQIITLLKQSAKTSGKAGTKVSVDTDGMLWPLVEIADTKKRIPIATFGDYTFYPKGRISPSKMLFSCADTDADGFYDINVAIDGTASAVYVTVEYTACPAMG